MGGSGLEVMRDMRPAELQPRFPVLYTQRSHMYTELRDNEAAPRPPGTPAPKGADGFGPWPYHAYLPETMLPPGGQPGFP